MATGGQPTVTELIPDEEPMSVGQFEHMILIGTTNTGKTHAFKQLLVDAKFEFEFEEFVYIGRGEQLPEIATAFAAYNQETSGSSDAREMKNFSFADLGTAVAYLEKFRHPKLCYMDDIFIQGNKIKKEVANFINQAKNSNTTCVLTIHEAFGGEPEKTVRNAANWIGMFNLSRDTIARATNYTISADNPKLNEYNARDKFKKILWFNTLTHTIYDHNYLPLLSPKQNDISDSSEDEN